MREEKQYYAEYGKSELDHLVTSTFSQVCEKKRNTTTENRSTKIDGAQDITWDCFFLYISICGHNIDKIWTQNA